MSRPSLPPNEARDWNKVLTRIENLENLVRVLASQDTPTKFSDLDDVDTIFAADQSVATLDAATGKVRMLPAAAGGFPFDDGTATFNQQKGSVAGTSQMITSVTNNSTGSKSEVTQSVDNSGHASTIIRATDASGNFAQVAVNALGQIGIFGSGLTATIQLGGSGDVVDLASLPTADPGVPGQAWNDSGTVKVSP